MSDSQELQVQQKRELENKEESTIPTRVFLPTADIYETSDALNVVIEMPGVEKSSVDVTTLNGRRAPLAAPIQVALARSADQFRRAAGGCESPARGVHPWLHHQPLEDSRRADRIPAAHADRARSQGARAVPGGRQRTDALRR